MSHVRDVVLRQLNDLVADDLVGRIRDEHRIIADLGLTGDDASFFAIDSMKELGIRLPVRAWDDVETVGDAIRLLEKACEEGGVL